MNKKMVRVAAGIIEKDGRYLICQRQADGGSCAGLWEFPGGKIEDETAADCVRRECMEELGVRVRVGELYDSVVHSYPDKEVSLIFYTACIVGGTPQRRVHRRIKWVSADKLSTYEFCPADRGIIEKLAGAAK